VDLANSVGVRRDFPPDMSNSCHANTYNVRFGHQAPTKMARASAVGTPQAARRGLPQAALTLRSWPVDRQDHVAVGNSPGACAALRCDAIPHLPVIGGQFTG